MIMRSLLNEITTSTTANVVFCPVPLLILELRSNHPWILGLAEILKLLTLVLLQGISKGKQTNLLVNHYIKL